MDSTLSNLTDLTGILIGLLLDARGECQSTVTLITTSPNWEFERPLSIDAKGGLRCITLES